MDRFARAELRQFAGLIAGGGGGGRLAKVGGMISSLVQRTSPVGSKMVRPPARGSSAATSCA
jgi:hypothetical protein